MDTPMATNVAANIAAGKAGMELPPADAGEPVTPPVGEPAPRSALDASPGEAAAAAGGEEEAAPALEGFAALRQNKSARMAVASGAAALLTLLWLCKPAPESFHSFCTSKDLLNGGGLVNSVAGGSQWMCSNSGLLRSMKVLNPSWRYHDIVAFSVVELAATKTFFVGAAGHWFAVPTLFSPVMKPCLDVLRVHMYILVLAVLYQLWTAVFARFNAFVKNFTTLITNAFWFTVFTSLVYYNSQASAYIATAVCAVWAYAYKYQHLKPYFAKLEEARSSTVNTVVGAGKAAALVAAGKATEAARGAVQQLKAKLNKTC